MGWYDCTVRRVRGLSCADTRVFLELEVRRVDCRRCGTVKRKPGDIAPCYAAYLIPARETLGWQTRLGIDAMCADIWRWRQWATENVI